MFSSFMYVSVDYVSFLHVPERKHNLLDNLSGNSFGKSFIFEPFLVQVAHRGHLKHRIYFILVVKVPIQLHDIWMSGTKSILDFLLFSHLAMELN